MMSSRSEKIFVVKDGDRIGPYTVDELLERVDNGEILYEDFCLRQGDSRHVPVREVLDWNDDDWREAGWDESYDDEFEEDEDDEIEAEGKAGSWPEPAARPAPAESSRHPIDDPATRLYAGHPALLSFPKSLLLSAVAIGQGIVLWNSNGWFLFGGLLVALTAFGYILVERSMREYIITPKRVEIIHGFLAKNSQEVRIDDIRAINVKKPGLLGLLGIGDVEFASAGSDTVEVVFAKAARPEAIKGLVRRLQDRV
jgi:hypothetical protein